MQLVSRRLSPWRCVHNSFLWVLFFLPHWGKTGRAHIGFSERADTVLNCTVLLPQIRTLRPLTSFYRVCQLTFRVVATGGREFGMPVQSNVFVLFCSVQFKVVSMRSEKPICVPPRFSEISSTLPLKVPIFVWLTMAFFRPFKEDRPAPVSSRRSMVWCPWYAIVY